MDVAKLFPNGKSQAVRLPKAYRFEGDYVYIKKMGSAVLLIPARKPWDIITEALSGLDEDFLSERGQGDQKRDTPWD
ncbi:MAG: vapB [Verrucomicrobiales bacterium]|nr:vapB [Verrucomicrobiales bacterium]